VVAGSYRRGVTKLRSMTIVTKCLPHEVHSILKDYNPRSVAHRKWTALVLLRDNTFPLFVVSTSDNNWGSRLLFYTGPTEFRKCICAEAREQGYLLASRGMFLRDRLIAGKSEESIYATLGLKYKHPKIRKRFTTKLRKMAKHERRIRNPETANIRCGSGYYVPTDEREFTSNTTGDTKPAKRDKRYRPRYLRAVARVEREIKKNSRGILPYPDETKRDILLDTWDKLSRELQRLPKARKKVVKKVYKFKKYFGLKAKNKKVVKEDNDNTNSTD